MPCNYEDNYEDFLLQFKPIFTPNNVIIFKYKPSMKNITNDFQWTNSPEFNLAILVGDI